MYLNGSVPESRLAHLQGLRSIRTPTARCMKEPQRHHQLIRDWAQRGHTTLLELVPLHAPLKDVEGEHRHKRAVMTLSTACLGETQSVLYLVLGLRLWTAEIVMRAVVEGTTKFGYLLESPATFTTRCGEYRDALPMIAKLRWHAKAEEALRALGPGGVERQPYRDLLLEPEELERIKTAFPREVRREIERRWGFTELINVVSKPGGAFGPEARTLLHGYSASSHLIHMSYEGVEMPLERDHRSDQRRDAITLTHAASMVSDCLQFTFLRLIALYRFASVSPAPLEAARERLEGFGHEFKEAARAWHKVEYPDLTTADD